MGNSKEPSEFTGTSRASPVVPLRTSRTGPLAEMLRVPVTCPLTLTHGGGDVTSSVTTIGATGVPATSFNGFASTSMEPDVMDFMMYPPGSWDQPMRYSPSG